MIFLNHFLKISILTTKIALGYFLLFIFVFNSLSISGQEAKGDRLIEEFQFAKAIKLYEKAIKRDTANDQLNYKLAEAFRKINNYPKSVQHYQKIKNIDALPSAVHLAYGQALMNTSNTAKAKIQFQQFADKNPNSLIAKLAIQSIDNVKEWRTVKRPFRVDTVSGINTPFSEFCPVPYQNGIAFTSDRQIDHYNDRSFGWTGTPYLSIYKALSLSSPKVFEEAVSFSNTINTDYHDGPISFDSSQVKSFYTRVEKINKVKDFTNRMKLYSSTWDGKKWGDEVDFQINSDEYSVGQPFFNIERNRLYFSSDMPGGYGGMDLYYVIKAKDGWSKPINLGRFINTAANEVFPSCYEDKLYFSSDGLSGYGGLDLFQSQITSVDHTQPINLKSPINTNADDFGLSFISATEGYFSSNRAGGKGMDDIYYFQMLDSAYSDTSQISGVFEYNGLPVEGVKLNLKDANGNIIEVVYTDAEGRFKFSSLPSDQSYLVTLDAEDDNEYDNANIFITNDEGEKVFLADRLSDGSFKFDALPLEIINQMELMEENDESLNTMMVTAQVFNKLPGDVIKPLKIYLFDDAGLIIDSVISNDQGKVTFKNLGVDKEYLIALDEDDPGMHFAIYNSSKRIVSLPEKLKDGKVYIDKDRLVDFNFISKRKTAHTVFVGKAELSKVSQSKLKLHLYNLSGDTLATTFTNENGEFEFGKLKTDDSYLIRISDDNPIAYQKAKLYSINYSGEKVDRLVRLKNGNFTFNALPLDKFFGTNDQSYQEDYVAFYGHVFKKLPGDFSDSIEVIILDDAGNIIGRTYTDKNGRFNFTKLDPDKQYTFVLNEGEDEDLSLILEDDVNSFLANTIRTGKGKFEYTKLTAEVAVLEAIAEDDEALVFAKGEYALFGQLYKKLPNDYSKAVMIYLLDEDGNIIDAVLSDEKGRFKFESLRADQNYSFKVGDESEDLNVVLYNIDDEVIASAAKLGRGNFKFTKLDIEKARVKLDEIEDSPIYYAFKQLPDSLRYIPLDTSYSDFLNQFVVYYNFDSYSIDSSEIGKLKDLAERLIKQPTINLEVISYADPMGPKRYNEKLSKRRTKSVMDYFQELGISKNRLKGVGKGEVNLLLIQDIINVPLTKEENRINRRTEFKIYMK